MTNNEKLKRIQDIVIDAAVNGTRKDIHKHYCSAEWNYDMGWAAAMIHIKKLVCDIIDQEEN